ncbi:16S rRNA (uracil(1498)-N(3))-methyltransferase [Staphylococcus sp. mip270_02]|uniref:Ribosomal RNA small subunit methyltransferase E n=1 Tax=Staphylococcus xylosus TaxID=1288 RepID=A0A418ILU0_STAXY|nr:MULTISPECIES: 16S rRNA (uracil(1498)-N(3))-methyltransferase [Staphylococcus]MBF0814006.1 16S rRNA (uracil(1498)-N(3))-methyltransferase [Staphylococcus saprophyticus]MDW8542301.1 16S rRNA (uracil(1498)-N(3))-methyltransferase [Staphylococcus sp. KG4-1]MRF36216.1 16S rRNA (uracil(1498)-N(3))-methyltransferase [Staphylococcus sp. KY49P]MDW8561667.1 16S rRNA (uracil(1498)-N(3))-methyltransferase [Staphylococcus sp. KG4-3]PTI04743.1 16S rRNA (uracil(1498)-N(3))-methyltransferase [Staphylococcu
MQRYFINQNADSLQRFSIIEKGDIHHILNVMRYQMNDEIIITFSDQFVYKCKISNIDTDEIEIELVEQIDIDSELPQTITICSGLIKADKYEWLLQKATELGASEFLAVGMKRSVVKLNDSKITKKLERWQKIIKEAAEQSYRLAIPSIDYKASLKEVFQQSDLYDYILIAYEDAAKQGEVSNLKKLIKTFQPNDRVLVIFGPEGGLAEEELALFNDNAYQVGLGPRILRAETAPLYVLSAISYELELLD